MARRKIADCRTLITGASGGIGRAIALELGRQGAKVLGVARRRERLAEVADAFDELPGRFEFVVGDVTDRATRHAMVEAAVERLGGLDALINNAGVGALGPFADADSDRLRRIIELNVIALAEMTRAALPELKRGVRPIIVNISSILGRRGIPYMSEYCASKFAVEGFSQALRTELEDDGIDVLVVAPGTTETEFFDHVVEKKSHPAWRDAPGVTAKKVARATVKAIRRGRAEIVPNFKGWLLCLGQRLSPRMMDAGMSRFAK